MKSLNRAEVRIAIDDVELGRSEIGWLRRDALSGREVLAFEWDVDWIANRKAPIIEPTLPLYEGEQYPGRLPGFLADTAPDRWGRYLLERREAAVARREGRNPNLLTEWDFLTAVSDVTRMGSLRLRDLAGNYVAAGVTSIPPLARLSALQDFAARAERGERLAPSEEEEEIALLIAPGSSLGGARPKANYVESDGSLWIAKFPSRNDRRDSGAWEFVLNRLARESGIDVPETRLVELAEGYRTFCARRFDREGSARRLFASAMTLTGSDDHQASSYPEIAEAITRFGSNLREEIDADLAQLFRRLAFNVLTAHRDDHLRNHGFLITTRGWRLAPAYDLNPLPELTAHTLSIDGSNSTPDLGLVVDTADYYRLKRETAEAVVVEVKAVVARWRDVARREGIKRDEIDLMENAFL